MERETINYRGKDYHRYPKSPRRQLRVYFWRHDTWKGSPVALHRQIWEDDHGKIPNGLFIHHKDSNPLNNDIGNLECVAPGEHTKHHTNNAQFKKQARINLSKYAQPKAREWHKSKSGRDWHKLHGKDCWSKKNR